MKHFLLLRLFVVLFLIMVASAAPASDIAELVQVCENCHGKGGNSIVPDVPIIAGFSNEGFVWTIRSFRDDERIAKEFHQPGQPETVMNETAKNLTERDIQKLADYFSAQAFKPAQQAFNADLADKGAVIHKKSCEGCHTGNGADLDSEAAKLAGQWTPYLKRQIDNFLSAKRHYSSEIMLRRLKKLNDDDVAALLNFYAREGLK